MLITPGGLLIFTGIHIGRAIWQGDAYIPVQKPITSATVVSLKANEDLGELLLGIEPDLYRWWNQLEVATCGRH